MTNKDMETDNKLLYPKLSYLLVGIAYEVDNILGYGHKEEVYCRAIENILKEKGIKHIREVYNPIKVNGKMIARQYFDFVIDDKIVLEIKAGEYNYKNVCQQLYSYLKASGYKLGIVFRYTRSGVRTKRIPCLY